jgi:pimeloyl-ACP methyl ester carboxylesterase
MPTAPQVIRMDFRGRGASDYADPATYQVPQEAADVLALLDHLKLPKVTILGTSRGGLVAMVLAASAKDRLAGVILNDVGPEIMTEGLAAIMTYIGRPPTQRTLAMPQAPCPPPMPTVSRTCRPRHGPPSPAACSARIATGLHLRYDPRLREAVAPAFAPDAVAPDLWPLFDAFAGLPLGLIRGANSNLLSVETAEEMRAAAPTWSSARCPGAAMCPSSTSRRRRR